MGQCKEKCCPKGRAGRGRGGGRVRCGRMKRRVEGVEARGWVVEGRCELVNGGKGSTGVGVGEGAEGSV